MFGGWSVILIIRIPECITLFHVVLPFDFSSKNYKRARDKELLSWKKEEEKVTSNDSRNHHKHHPTHHEQHFPHMTQNNRCHDRN